jgi:hypothetical protein
MDGWTDGEHQAGSYGGLVKATKILHVLRCLHPNQC